MNTEYIDVTFPVKGGIMTDDCVYKLFSSGCHVVPELKTSSDIFFTGISGVKSSNGEILITDRSIVRMRLPVDKIKIAYQLGNQTFVIGKSRQYKAYLGMPQLKMVLPSPSLKARIVTIKGHQTPESFIAAIARQMDAMGISGDAVIPQDDKGEFLRQVVRIHGKTILGFPLIVSNLSDEDSLTLQKRGIGGRKHFGCGLFLPFSSRPENE